MDVEVSEAFRQRAKMLMRKRFRSHRRGLTAGSAARRSARIVERLLNHPRVTAAKAIASFMPMIHRNEVDLRAAHAAWREAGKTVLFPRTHDEGPMTWHAVTTETDFQTHPMGFLEPITPVAGPPELIVVPGLAFDARGHRIGYGGGFYDRTIAAHLGVPTIGVAFHFQLAADLPDTPGDVPVDCIITDEDVLEL